MARRPARPLGTISVEILGSDLPGRECGPDTEGNACTNIHVGLKRGGEAVERVPGDAPSARWELALEVRVDEEGALDFGGPCVYGPRDARCLGLTWLREAADGNWVVFRAAKFRLYELPRSLFEAALQPERRLVARVGLTDRCGWPRCATVRPPDVAWTVE